MYYVSEMVLALGQREDDVFFVRSNSTNKLGRAHYLFCQREPEGTMTVLGECTCEQCQIKNASEDMRKEIELMPLKELRGYAKELIVSLERKRIKSLIDEKRIDELEECLTSYEEEKQREIAEEERKEEKCYEQFVEDMVLKSVVTMRDNALGLTAEAGEVAGKVYKAQRDMDGFVDKQTLGMELGDVLFYVTALGNAIGWTLKEIEIANRAKLTARRLNGTLQGNGDQR